MTPAILCSGQGPQHPAMFTLTGAAPEAADLFAHAAALLGGRDPRALVQTAQPAELHHNREGQILCALQALAAAAMLRTAWPPRLIIAGYSVGEVAAWGVAGLMDPRNVLDLVARRADAMNASSAPGDGLLFVRGLSRQAVDELCQRNGAAVAIVNPGEAFVIGGAGAALDALAEAAKGLGAARVVRIGVTVASHTPHLAAASVAFRRTLAETPVRRGLNAGVRLFSGIDASPVLDIGAGLDKLAAQISHTVQWAACLDGCVEAGASAFLELGPGRALTNMAAEAWTGLPARSLEEFRTPQGASAWLARAT
jgi:[acyl-carrier-protein] S-malonyltransferase